MKTAALLLLSLSLTMAAFSQAKGSGKIFAVRHAEKQSHATDTPLSDKGQNRAHCLAQTLADAHIATVITSQYIRTKQTAAPLVKESHASTLEIDGKSTDQVVTFARAAAEKGNVLIVAHSNTLPAILAALGAQGVTIPDTAYDQLFIVTASNPKGVTTLHYCPNLPADTTKYPTNSMAKP
jgi:broad specificity phosphatase PhoE